MPNVLCARIQVETGGRLTSDPIRTSLGLLPSGPDPVGEWLVHRQSPGPYLEPNPLESKPRPVGESLMDMSDRVVARRTRKMRVFALKFRLMHE